MDPTSQPPDSVESLHVSQVSSPTETVGPAGVADQPTTSDSLGFTPYVQAVAAFLTHEDTRPPLTVSIEGPWGSGKSSFMKQLQEEINRCVEVQEQKKEQQRKAGQGQEQKQKTVWFNKKKHKPLTVWFNAWRQNKDEELWAAFALHFSEEISKQLFWLRRHWCHLKLRWARFDMKRAWPDVTRFLLLSLFFIYLSVHTALFLHHHPNLLPSFMQPNAGQDAEAAGANSPDPEKDLLKIILVSAGGVGYILLAFMFLKRTADIVGNPLKIDLEKYVADPKYGNRLAFIETFQSDFTKMVKSLAREEKVYVFIDDLDRCEVPRAAELMQALNMLISDSANVVYLLGLDREKIAAGIAAKFQSVLPYLTKGSADPAEALDFGFNYLEKFIQIPFQVPRPAAPDVERLMNKLNQQAQPATEAGPTGEAHVDPGILFETKADSELVREIVRMVSPAFDFNPRRIKQFINCFRVHAIIASQIGMFAEKPKSDKSNQRRRLSPQHLGKLIAICLRWPRLLDHIAENSDFLDNFPCDGSEPSNNKPITPLEYWSRDQRLSELILYCADKTPEDLYSMKGVDVSRFLVVAPQIRRWAPETAPDQPGSTVSHVKSGVVPIKAEAPPTPSPVTVTEIKAEPSEREWSGEASGVGTGEHRPASMA